MGVGIRAASVAAVLAVASFTLYAQTTPLQSAEIQRQLGEEFFAEGRYQDALDAFQRALVVAAPDDLRAHAQVRGSGGRVQQLRQPAAEQGSQREGRLVALRDQVSPFVRAARALRDGSEPRH